MMQDETHQFCIVEVSGEHCVQVPVAAIICMMVMGFAVSRDGFERWQQSLCVLRRQAYMSRSCLLLGQTRHEVTVHMQAAKQWLEFCL